ncbi:MAG: HD domain-containing protein [Armatimonadetes bacterium]|nr:HD domain-containing protein [Armatimonadota bacterium]
MQTAPIAYRVFRWTSVVLAVWLTWVTWDVFQVRRADFASAAWFLLAGILAELLVKGQDNENRTEITPSAPIYWAAACVLGPPMAIAVCFGSYIFADIIGLIVFGFVRNIEIPQNGSNGNGLLWKPIIGRLKQTGRCWERRLQGDGQGRLIETTLSCPCSLVLSIGLASVVYHWLGGRFLLDGGPTHIWFGFIFPFLGLAATAIALDVVQNALASVLYDPIPRQNGILGWLARTGNVIIGNELPLIPPQSLLVIVSMMLSYLYVNLGAWAFILTSLPIVGLRDYYYQRIAEQSAYLDTITTLATYMQHYHPYTRGHLKRVADISEKLARELRLSAESINNITTAGLLHDIGKIGVSEEILNKTSTLEPEEWDMIKEHPDKGAEIISHLDFVEGIVDWIRYHHKWHDGRGYPETNTRSAIPIEASIIAVADSFDAMTDDRELSLEWICDSCGYSPDDDGRPAQCPLCGAHKRRTYRVPRTLEGAIDELRRGSGTQFHPAVVQAFLKMLDKERMHTDVA